MKRRNLSILVFGLFLISSCGEVIDKVISPQSITLTANPGAITISQNLKLVATVVFTGGLGSPEQFSVRFLNGTEILAESVVSGNKTATKDIPVTKAMNGTLTIKARVFLTNSTDTSSVNSQPVIVTVNIP
jgi:hypothetical protein